MLDHLVQWHLDAIAFAALTLAGMVGVHLRLRWRHGSAGMPLRNWITVVLLLAAGALLAEAGGDYERRRLTAMLEGIAPTYAQEMQLLDHAKVGTQTPADDPAYLRMVQAQLRWVNANVQVADVYTFRKGEGDQVVFVVDSETDYNRNGQIDDDREQRTAIGEVYEEVTDNMRLALEGQRSFDGVPETDRWGTWVSAFVPLYDADGKLEGALGVDYDAREWVSAIARVRAVILGLAAGLLVILITTTTLLQLTRIEMARREVAEREREQMRQALIAASRQAGMAEIATGVLHNVGNALNSVNVSAGVVAERLRNSKIPALGRAASLIRANSSDLPAFLTGNEKGRQLPEFLCKLADFLAAEQTQMLDELAQLGRSIDHIKQAVASQQQHAKGAAVSDVYEMHKVLDEALQMSALSFERHHIEIVRDYGQCPAVCGDSHKTLQILINLVSNAKHAVCGNSASRTITLRAEPAGDAEHPTVRVAVSDNGVGISPENQAKLFTHGFSTRPDGHGFGLHSAAIAARQMGGTLTAASAGEGHGATFTLELPLHATQVPV